MTNEEFSALFIKVEAHRVATRSFVHVLVQRLVKDCGLDAEMLLEHLHILQSNLPSLDAHADEGQAAIAKEVLSAFGGLVQAVDEAVVAASED
jgi:hypothetical protein